MIFFEPFRSLSLRWDVHATSLVGAGVARPAAGSLPAGLCSGSRSPVHPPLRSRVQQPPAPALPGHTGPTQWRVRSTWEWFFFNNLMCDTFVKEKMVKTLVFTQAKLMETQTFFSFCKQFSCYSLATTAFLQFVFQWNTAQKYYL